MVPTPKNPYGPWMLPKNSWHQNSSQIEGHHQKAMTQQPSSVDEESSPNRPRREVEEQPNVVVRPLPDRQTTLGVFICLSPSMLCYMG